MENMRLGGLIFENVASDTLKRDRNLVKTVAQFCVLRDWEYISPILYTALNLGKTRHLLASGSLLMSFCEVEGGGTSETGQKAVAPDVDYVVHNSWGELK